MKNIWYEVYAEKSCGETVTLEVCNTIKEARLAKEDFNNQETIHLMDGKLYDRKELKISIDKWKNPENPLPIGEII